MVSKWLRRTAVRRTLFAAAVFVLTAAVGWLGSRELARDRQLAGQRAATDRETAADLVVASLEQRLAVLERDLDAALARGQIDRRAPAPGEVMIRIIDDAVETVPKNRLRYVPFLPSRSTTPAAEDLVQRAQVSLRAGRFTEALEFYDHLEQLGPVPIGDVVGGIPAALFAHLGRMTVAERQRDDVAAATAAQHLADALAASEWPVSAATYAFLHEQAQRASKKASGPDAAMVLAEAAAWLWDSRASDPFFSPSGRVSRVFASGPALVVWRTSSDQLAAWIANRDSIDRVWIAALEPVLGPRRARLSMATADGTPILGAVSPQERPAERAASATLPWTIRISNTPDNSALTDRRRLLLGGMGVLIALLVAGTWLMERTVARELAVADLQSDFVSAVSHEFRTPLTTLCQLSEMLMRGRVASDDDRRQYYELLNGESQRLRRLVETLLNFGRLEAGRMEFHFAEVDVTSVVRRTVAEFGASPQARRHRVELTGADVAVQIRGDAEVLRTVVWNLLENAAKYSPDCDTIWVNVAQRGGDATLSVRDRGVGIPRGEHRQVFEKFVRGAGARASDVGGTGVGLAMARRIVEAHGGDITLESEPGAGSTFTVVLPPVNSQLPTTDAHAVEATG